MHDISALKATLAALETPGLALDIDDTLSSTMEYWIKGLSENFGNPYNLTAENVYERFVRCEAVPGWDHAEARCWMEARRDDNELQVELGCISGSREHVPHVHAHTPIHLYLTARPLDVLDGTKRWLEKHGFPNAPIIARPPAVEHENNAAWKARILDELFPIVTGIIDNDEAVAAALPSTYQGTIYLLSRKPFQRKDNVRVIQRGTWEDMRRAVTGK